jgi:hypothetical protein
MQPEELTELLDDDLEMWAQGGTRILPKSQLEKPKPDSFPPVAYPSVFPTAPPVVTTSSSNAPVWAAVIGMAAVFFFAAVGGGIFYALHRSASTTTESVASQSVSVATTMTTSEPQQVTLTTTSEPIAVATPVITATATATATPTQKMTSMAAAPPPVVRYGAIQTFAAGAGKPVFLDGKQIGTGGSHLKAACGKHSIAVGSGKAKTYDIPCSGNTAITVGTPDGT